MLAEFGHEKCKFTTREERKQTWHQSEATPRESQRNAKHVNMLKCFYNLYQ